jgi:hypothetical protein
MEGEANGRGPKPAALAGGYSQRLAACKTQTEYTALCQEIKSAVAAKRLSNGDRDTLLAAAREAAVRFPAAPEANGKVVPEANGKPAVNGAARDR